jgi:FkbM family methyltransferase
MEAFQQRLARELDLRAGAAVVGNFDADRWGTTPDMERREREATWAAATRSLLEREPQAFQKVHEMLADELSRELFVEVVLYRLLGHRHVRLPRNNESHWAQRELVQALPRAESPFSGAFGKLHRFDLEFEGQRVLADCWWTNIAWTFFIRQYYLERGDILVRPSAGDCIIDAGACFGDTALAFAASAGARGRVYAFEIDPSNLEVARHNLALNPLLLPRITLCEEALGDTEAQRYLHGSGPGAQVLDRPGGRAVKMTTLDRYVERMEIERVDFIKMDIEGAELGALKGAVGTLRKFRPRLAISLYHRPDDLLRIPLWLNSLGLGYQFYLEHYTIHYEETVLYASPRT